jgi:preprotein translocase subunit SecG
MSLLIPLFYILFVLSAIVLIVVVLLQEGKGGGFGSALGEHGQQTFGVGAKGINTFTGYTAAIFLFCALMLHIFNRSAQSDSVLSEGEGSLLNAPAEPAGGGE